MSEVFIIRNQLGHFWAKSKSWVDGSDARAVMRAKHEDEAINTLVELSAKDIELRGDVIAAELSSRGDPVVETSEIPLPEVVVEEVETPVTEAENESSPPPPAA